MALPVYLIIGPGLDHESWSRPCPHRIQIFTCLSVHLYSAFRTIVCPRTNSRPPLPWLHPHSPRSCRRGHRHITLVVGSADFAWCKVGGCVETRRSPKCATLESDANMTSEGGVDHLDAHFTDCTIDPWHPRQTRHRHKNAQSHDGRNIFAAHQRAVLRMRISVLVLHLGRPQLARSRVRVRSTPGVPVSSSHARTKKRIIARGFYVTS